MEETLGDIDFSDDDEPITAQKVLETLEDAWLNEKFSPEILPQQSDMVECMLGQIQHMEENMEKLNRNDFRLIAHKMELERIRYIVSSYLRRRLDKIELYTLHILNEERSRRPEGQRLSEGELKFAQEILNHQDNHLNQVALRHMPGNLQNNDCTQTVVKPNMMSHVFLKATKTVTAVVVGAGDEEVDLAQGSQHVMQYLPAADLVRGGSVQLM